MKEHAFLVHLRRDHAEQKRLAQQLIETADPQEREQLRSRFHDALYPHLAGEEVSIFRRLRNADAEEVREDALEGLEEHHVATILLRELMELDPASATFRAKMKVLDEHNRHHVGEEERKLFKHLADLCGPPELDRLFAQYEAGEEEARSRAAEGRTKAP